MTTTKIAASMPGEEADALEAELVAKRKRLRQAAAGA